MNENGINFNDISRLREEKMIKTSQRQLIFSSIASPISLFLGGVILSTISLCVVISARKKIKCLLGSSNLQIAEIAKLMLRPAKFSFVATIIILAINVFFLISVLVILSSLIASGDTQQLYEIFGGTKTSSSTW